MYCSHFTTGTCRSCSLLTELPDQVLQLKYDALAGLFPEVAAPDDFPPAALAYGSRIRAKLAVAGSVDEPVVGFHGSHQQLIAVDDCPLHHPAINDFVATLPELVREYRLTPYCIETDSGELKFVVLTWSPSHQQLMVQWVLRSREAVERIQKLFRQLPADSGITVMSINIQPIRSSVILGPDEIAVSDNRSLPVTFCDRTLFYGPQSFIQTSYSVAQQLYQHVRSILRQRDARGILELYCGVGTFLVTSANEQTLGLGLEISDVSIFNARTAARVNDLPGLQFKQHDSSLPFSDQVMRPAWDAVICNPPRRGLDAGAIQLLKSMRPGFLIYSSCNPETLRRDIDLLPGYRLSQLRPFDMFPMTHHVEVVAILER